MTPLFKKLNLKSENLIHVLNAPESFEAELEALAGPEIRRSIEGEEPTTFAIAFAITRAEVDALSATLVKAAKGDAILWVAYPKGTSKKYKCEFNRDNGWEVFGAAGYEPVRMVAIDEDWSALRFRRAENLKTMTRDPSMALSDVGKERTKPKSG